MKPETAKNYRYLFLLIIAVMLVWGTACTEDGEGQMPDVTLPETDDDPKLDDPKLDDPKLDEDLKLGAALPVLGAACKSDAGVVCDPKRHKLYFCDLGEGSGDVTHGQLKGKVYDGYWAAKICANCRASEDKLSASCGEFPQSLKNISTRLKRPETNICTLSSVARCSHSQGDLARVCSFPMTRTMFEDFAQRGENPTGTYQNISCDSCVDGLDGVICNGEEIKHLFYADVDAGCVSCQTLGAARCVNDGGDKQHIEYCMSDKNTTLLSQDEIDNEKLCWYNLGECKDCSIAYDSYYDQSAFFKCADHERYGSYWSPLYQDNLRCSVGAVECHGDMMRYCALNPFSMQSLMEVIWGVSTEGSYETMQCSQCEIDDTMMLGTALCGGEEVDIFEPFIEEYHRQREIDEKCEIRNGDVVYVRKALQGYVAKVSRQAAGLDDCKTHLIRFKRIRVPSCKAGKDSSGDYSCYDDAEKDGYYSAMMLDMFSGTPLTVYCKTDRHSRERCDNVTRYGEIIAISPEIESYMLSLGVAIPQFEEHELDEVPCADFRSAITNKLGVWKNTNNLSELQQEGNYGSTFMDLLNNEKLIEKCALDTVIDYEGMRLVTPSKPPVNDAYDSDEAEDDALDDHGDVEPVDEELFSGCMLSNGDKAIVTHITDGDTLHLVTSSKKHCEDKSYVIRVHGIDTPECQKEKVNGRYTCVKDNSWSRYNEPYGYESAKQVKTWLPLKKEITVLCDSNDEGHCKLDNTNRRYLADIGFELGDKKVTLAEQLIREGLGYAFTKYYSPNIDVLCAAEREAYKAGKNLWSHGDTYEEKISNVADPSNQTWLLTRKHRDCLMLDDDGKVSDGATTDEDIYGEEYIEYIETSCGEAYVDSCDSEASAWMCIDGQSMHLRCANGCQRFENGIQCDYKNNEGVLLTLPAEKGFLLRIMAANTTSGNQQNYEGPGIRMFQAFQPDIALVQEFRYMDGTLRDLVDKAFGTNYHFFAGEGRIRNGVVSRYPIIESGEALNMFTGAKADRHYTYAVIDIPGPKELLVLSLHLNTKKNSQEIPVIARLVKDLNPDNRYYVVVGGDFNTANIQLIDQEFGDILYTEKPLPSKQDGSTATNATGRKLLDWLLVGKMSMQGFSIPTLVGNMTYDAGLVFDSRVYEPLNDVSPVQYDDSDAHNMQHMPIIRDFYLPVRP